MRLFLSRSSATVRTLCRTEQSPSLFVLHKERLFADRARLLDLWCPVVMLLANQIHGSACVRAVPLVQSSWLNEDPTTDRTCFLLMPFRLPVRMGGATASVDKAVLFMCQHLQVFRAIIVALVVAMMDLFLVSKWPAEHLASDQAMLQDVAVLHRVRMVGVQQQHIAVACRNSTSRPSRIPGTTGPAISGVFHHRRVYL
jgi:hypothetical protein